MSLGIPRKQLGPTTVTITGQRLFVDHTSAEGISAYVGKRLASVVPDSANNHNNVNKVLPPFFSFQVYITYGPTLARAPSSLVPDFVSRAMAEMNRNDQFEHPVRFDLHFLPGRGEKEDVEDVISHYRAEGKALPDYSSQGPGRPFRGMLIVLSKETWKTEGVSLVFFDPPAAYLRGPPEEREAILGNSVSDDGVLVINEVSAQQGGWDGLSVRLRALAESSRQWDEFKDQYDDAVLRGKTEW